MSSTDQRVEEMEARLARLEATLKAALSTTLDQGEVEKKLKHTELSEVERQTVRSMFDQFDTDKSGSIDIKELGALHEEMGEPLTEDELKDAQAALTEGAESDHATFEQFLKWWVADHKRADRYRKRFKFKHGQVDSGSFDVSKLRTVPSGKVGTLKYRVYFEYPDAEGKYQRISPWHDIPLRVHQGKKTNAFHFICEIPKWTRAKYEVSTGELYNPIKQDTKNGLLRSYQHGDMCFNYGCLPQTWEDPEHVTPETEAVGDNDPIDVLEIGYKQLSVGSVTAVKIIGVLALVDSGETDWKLIVIALSDPLADRINSVEDCEKEIPGAIHAIREYLRVYKVCTGKKANTYGFDGECQDTEYAIKTIEETQEFWQKLTKGGKRELD